MCAFGNMPGTMLFQHIISLFEVFQHIITYPCIYIKKKVKIHKHGPSPLCWGKHLELLQIKWDTQSLLQCRQCVGVNTFYWRKWKFKGWVACVKMRPVCNSFLSAHVLLYRLCIVLDYGFVGLGLNLCFLLWLWSSDTRDLRFTNCSHAFMLSGPQAKLLFNCYPFITLIKIVWAPHPQTTKW